MSPSASRETLVRRTYFAITGLPPTHAQVREFVEDSSQTAFADLVDRLLQSDHYGERWARHWMDLVRYADSHGSEGDPVIPNIYRYRDYLIRAFNSDVPYDQLVLEHLAGDLIESPRINRQLNINESAIGPAHFRLCFHGFAPTDALDEKVRFTDDQINVLSKAFLGMTVSCARCHDHKFDAISQEDYTAWFGIVGSTRPAMVDVRWQGAAKTERNELHKLRNQLQGNVASYWLSDPEGRRPGVEAFSKALSATVDALLERNGDGAIEITGPLSLLAKVEQQMRAGENFAEALETIKSRYDDEKSRFQADLERFRKFASFRHSQSSSEPPNKEPFQVFHNGVGLKYHKSGWATLSQSGESIVDRFFPAGHYTQRLSKSDPGVFSTSKIRLGPHDVAYVRMIGQGDVSARYVVQHYPRSGTVYPIPRINKDDWHWLRLDLKYWQGDDIHLEITTAMDAPLETRNVEDSWFGIRDVVVLPADQPAPSDFRLEFAGSILESPELPDSKEQLQQAVIDSIAAAINEWKVGELGNANALLLNAALSDEIMMNRSSGMDDSFAQRLKSYRDRVAALPKPVRVPGVVDHDCHDSPFFDRGDHRKPKHSVERRFLEAIDSTPYQLQPTQSGRLQLAKDILRKDNPLAARVIVNRIWHYLFGQGIVSTPDNFGQLGAKPIHPELLDFLAEKMVHDGWSIKKMIRFIMLSRAWQQSSVASRRSLEIDPANQLLSHANLRRLDAEAIRDSLHSVSGTLDRKMYGPGFAANGQTPRRSVYITSRRNALDEFLATFDSPVPFSTTGARPTTNVPAQALTLLNDPMVTAVSRKWASRMAERTLEDSEKIISMFSEALGRLPTDDEAAALQGFLVNSREQIASQNRLRRSLVESLTKDQQMLDSIVEPVRKRLLQEKNTGEIKAAPSPLASWDFRDSINDTAGILHAQLHGSARLDQGLILDGAGFVMTPPIQKGISAKTLEVRLQLTDLNQRGGGAIGIQDLAGNRFDSIVFGERQPGKWISGSDFFNRTNDVDGPVEKTTDLVHLAITYKADGTIGLFRNGTPYGKPYRKSALNKYSEGNAQIVFGLRHGKSVSRGRMLKAKILEARFYDRALSPDEIMSAASGSPFVSQKEIWQAMTNGQREKVERLRTKIEEGQQEMKRVPAELNANEAWVRLALAIFNLKEFIYVR